MNYIRKRLDACLLHLSFMMVIKGILVLSFMSVTLAGIDKSMLDKCCLKGTQYATESRRCDNYPGSISEVSADDQLNCRTILHVCCMKQKQGDQCQNGKLDAVSSSRCVVRDDVFGSEQYKECCHCCKLGLTAQSMNGDCQLLTKADFGGPCDQTFTECCQGSQQGKSVNDTTNDIDECNLHAGRLCSHTCINTPGSFRCECYDGFTLHTDGSTCIEDTPVGCDRYNPCQQQCIEDDNGISCACNSGYTLMSDGINCKDIDECATNVSMCPTNMACFNQEGTYRCRSCPAGMEVNPVTKTCQAANRCPTGYLYNSSKRQCEDINECAREMDTCTSTQRCENTVGSFVCRRLLGCGTGYSLLEESQTCVDINECALGTHNCGKGYACVNIEGSFRCRPQSCDQGYRFSSSTGKCEEIKCPRGRQAHSSGMCVDIDECQQSGNPVCLPTERCVNTYGSYRCLSNYNCQPGYETNPTTRSCVDIDECVRGTYNCTVDQTCVNRPGSYDCSCSDGYQKNFSGACTDINECAYGYVCPFNGVCENTPGSYKCSCNSGLKQEGRSCVDIDECQDRSLCQHKCVNIVGSYHCTCRTGYRLNTDKRTCTDVDECRTYQGRGRICGGACINTPGSYMCSCPEGWRTLGGGRACQDIDECVEGTARCRAKDSMCYNTRGSYKCPQISCPSGFVRTPIGSRRNSVRCKRISFTCQRGDIQCLTAPISLSYNFLSFPSNIKIPTDLFAMSGPQSSEKKFEWSLKVIDSQPLKSDITAVNRGYFDLKIRNAQAVVSLNYRIPGPQDIELELTMQITDIRSGYRGTAVSKIFLYVTSEDLV